MKRAEVGAMFHCPCLREDHVMTSCISPVNSFHELSEEDVKRLYITPALERNWGKDCMRLEYPITVGRVDIRGNKPCRGNGKRADYLLFFESGIPLAVVEAKSKKFPPAHGLQQAKEYAQMMDLSFAYSSNGESFVEYDFLTGKEREFPLDHFPTQEELHARLTTGKHMSEEVSKINDTPYYTDGQTHAARYYQWIAINRTVDAVARGEKRILLAMATGTGKTFTAFQIVYRLLKSGMVKKVLYLADRNVLVDQSKDEGFAPLESVVHKVNYAADVRNPAVLTSYQVYFALYQQLMGGEESENEDSEKLEERIVDEKGIEKLRNLFPPDYFDLVIVDECHRGSAREDSNWRRILEYFSDSVQIGLTATPKETKYVSNIDYFGEPIYQYSLKQGIDDGFLAPFKVMNVTLNIGDGWRPYKGQRDVEGELIPDRIYNNVDYDYNISLLDRTRQVAETITDYLKKTDRMAKTIVFCATEEAALRMRQELVNLNSDMMKENPDYVVRITGGDAYGKSKLDYFTSVGEKFPVIATTSKLLTTGVDCKMTKLIALDENISSLTEFKQILGRGTRLRFDEGKTHFMVMDFRNVTHLFADPAWDGEPIQDPEFSGSGGEGGVGKSGAGAPTSDAEPKPELESKYKPIVDRNGCTVCVLQKIVRVYNTDGTLSTVSVVDFTRRNIQGEYATLDDFICKWSQMEKKKTIRELLAEAGLDLDALKAEEGMSDYDDFDFICHVAYDQKALTRQERVNRVKKRDFFSRYGGEARNVLEALLERYRDHGIYEIEDIAVLNFEPFAQYGKPSVIVRMFGGKEKYLEAVRLLEREIYAEEAV